MRGFRDLDRILRGEATAAPALSRDGLAVIPLAPLFAVNVLLAAWYGACMGVFGLSGRAEPEWRFMLADAVKVPLLFLLTLAVTFPSLYVFNTILGSKLPFGELVRLLTSAMSVLIVGVSALLMGQTSRWMFLRLIRSITAGLSID